MFKIGFLHSTLNIVTKIGSTTIAQVGTMKIYNV